MALTETDKDLINGLVMFGVEEKAIIGILSGLKTQDMREQMIDYLLNNREATQSDILLQLVEITK